MIDYELLRAEAARHPYPLLFATVSGAHSTASLPRIRITTCAGRTSCPRGKRSDCLPKRETIEFSGWRGGVEMDLVTHDVQKFFRCC